MMIETQLNKIETFKKPIEALVLMPIKGCLSPQSRKMFNVILHITQNMAKQVIASGKTFMADEYFQGHTFSARLKDILNPQQIDHSESMSESNGITSAKKCFCEMRRTESDWCSPDEGATVLFSSMSLLSQAEIIKENGVLKAHWAFPPKIMQMLMNPKLYTPLEYQYIEKLKTYGALALYEICVRYKFKGKPTALTAIHDLEWWVDALTASPKYDSKTGKKKLRPWVKFKYDQGNRAIEEINEKTNIQIELIEHKGKGKTIVAAQFKVTHKDMIPTLVVDELSPKMTANLAEEATAFNIDLRIVQNLIREGQSESGIKAAFAKLRGRNPNLAPIENIPAYLSTVLTEINPMIDHSLGQVLKSELTILPKETESQKKELPLALTYKDERRILMRDELRHLAFEDQKVYAYLALADLRKSKMSSASFIEKIEAGVWESAPILFSKMVEIYAIEKYGLFWGVE